MEEEVKIPKKLSIDCSSAAMLMAIKEAGDITFYQRLQLAYHNLGCKLCKVWAKQSAKITKMIQKAFSGEKHTLTAKKKEEMEKQIDELFI